MAILLTTREEAITEAMNRGYTIILPRENEFPELYMPAGEAFDACAAGLQIKISPRMYHMQKKAITKA